MKISKSDAKTIYSLVLVIIIFLVSSYFIQKNISFFEGYLGDNVSSMVTYAVIEFLASLFAPINTFPLIPLASNLWGWPLASVLTFIGWFAGALLAFIIARKFGSRVVARFAPVMEVKRLESLISNKNRFWSIVVIRILLPLDILSYAFGLFSKIPFSEYALATAISIIPHALLISYIGSLDFKYQLIGASLLIIILFTTWSIVYPKFKRSLYKK
ncbi:MAG: VTT domain-containing protein [Nanoarchaeota archaeon]